MDGYRSMTEADWSRGSQVQVLAHEGYLVREVSLAPTRPKWKDDVGTTTLPSAIGTDT